MPIYEYRCVKCDVHFEALVRPGRDDAECPRCGGTRLSREMSTFAARSASGNDSAAAEQAVCSNGLAGSSAGVCCGGACGCR